MKLRHLFRVVLGCIAYTCTWASAWAAPGAAERSIVEGNDYGVDHRLYTRDGDWRSGFSKTECGYPFPTMVGFADNGDIAPYGPWYTFNAEAYLWTTDATVCASSNTVTVDYSSGVSVWFGDQDARLDTSTGDWAYGLAKAECGNNEVMTGFAQQNEGINEFRCSPAYTWYVQDPLEATSCAVVDYDGHDGYDPYVPGAYRGDWYHGDSKGNCGANRYIKGFAVDTIDGSTNPVKILCCGAQLYSNGWGCNADEQCLGGICNGVCTSPSPGK